MKQGVEPNETSHFFVTSLIIVFILIILTLVILILIQNLLTRQIVAENAAELQYNVNELQDTTEELQDTVDILFAASGDQVEVRENLTDIDRDLAELDRSLSYIEENIGELPNIEDDEPALTVTDPGMFRIHIDNAFIIMSIAIGVLSIGTSMVLFSVIRLGHKKRQIRLR